MVDVELALSVWVKDPFQIISSSTIEYPDNVWQIFLQRMAINTSIDLTIRRYGYNLLHYAVGSRYFKLIEVLIDRGMDVNEPNSRGFTSLQSVTRSMNSYKNRICRVINILDDRCTDYRIRNLTLTGIQMAMWGRDIEQWRKSYLIDYDIVGLLESHGAEEF